MRLPQQHLVLQDHFPVPRLFVLLVAVTHMIGGLERGRVVLPDQLVPRILPQPGVLPYLPRIHVAESTRLLPLQQSVHEVGRLHRPVFWDLVLLDLDLVAHDLVPYLPAVAAVVGSPSQHDFIGNDPQCEVICGVGVVLATNNLWGHVTRSATGVIFILVPECLGHSQVRDARVPVAAEHDVLRLDVPMDDVVAVQELQS